MKISKLDASLVRDELLPSSCNLSCRSIEAIMDSYDAKAQARGEESEEFNAEFFEGWEEDYEPSETFRKLCGYTKTRKEEARIAAELEAEGKELEGRDGGYTNDAEEKFFEALRAQEWLEVIRVSQKEVIESMKNKGFRTSSILPFYVIVRRKK